VHERGHLDTARPCCDETLDEFDLGSSGEHDRFVLESVSGTDFDEFNADRVVGCCVWILGVIH
jgi:hypothetical protein